MARGGAGDRASSWLPGRPGWLPLLLVVCVLLAGCTEPRATTAATAAGSAARQRAGTTATVVPWAAGQTSCEQHGPGCPADLQVPGSLRRPLRIPPKPAEGGCPRTTRTHRASWGELLLGPGPLYAGSVVPDGPQRLQTLEVRGQPVRWRGFKTRWVVDAGYAGPALIRGRELGGGARVGFGLDPEPWPELQLWPHEPQGVGFRMDFRGATRVPRPGCYAWQIDGDRFTEVIVFQAVR
jgi:hypothetical protein